MANLQPDLIPVNTGTRENWDPAVKIAILREVVQDMYLLTVSVEPHPPTCSLQI